MQVKPPCVFTPEETEYLTKRIQDGRNEVVQVQHINCTALYNLQWNKPTLTIMVIAGKSWC